LIAGKSGLQLVPATSGTRHLPRIDQVDGRLHPRQRITTSRPPRAKEAYLATSAVSSPQVTLSLMLVPPMVASANPVAGPGRGFDERPLFLPASRWSSAMTDLPGELTVGAVHGHLSGQGLARRAAGDQGPLVN